MFDPAKAITPIPVGQYEEQVIKYSERTYEVGTLRLSGNLYTWKVGDQVQGPFRLFDIGNGFIMLQIERRPSTGDASEFFYDLLELRSFGFLRYGVQCVDILDASPTPEKNPAISDSYFGLVCTFADQDQLVASVRAATRRIRPIARYVSVE